MENKNRTRLAYIVSMLIFGTIAPFVRAIPVSSGEVALYRAVLAALLIGVYLAVTGKKIPVKSGEKDVLLLLLSGAVMGFNWIFLFEAYKYTTVSVATLSYYFAPSIVTAVSVVLFREPLGKKQIFCFLGSTLGLILITGVQGSNGGSDWIGILFGLAAAVFYAGVILLNKGIRSVEGIQRTFLQFLSAIAAVLPYVALTEGFHLSSLDTKGWASLMTVGLIHTGITYCLYFGSVKEMPGQQAAVLGYLDPLTAVLISVAFLGERLSLTQWIGATMILLFSVWNELPAAEKREK